MTARELLTKARDYMLHKAGRHDLNWRDANHIIDEIDAHLAKPEGEAGMPEYPHTTTRYMIRTSPESAEGREYVLRTDYDALRQWVAYALQQHGEWLDIESAAKTFRPPLSQYNHHAPDILGLCGQSLYCVCSWGGPSAPFWIDSHNSRIPFQPTHWQPLPKPPGERKE